MQRLRDVAVVDKDILFNIESFVSPFKVTRLIVLNALSQDQVLRARRRTNGIGLHKTHFVQRAL